MGIVYDFGIGGYDISFDVTALAIGQSISVGSKIAVTKADAEDPGTAKSSVAAGRDNNGYYFQVADKNGSIVERYYDPLLDNLGIIRIVFHNEFVTTYVDHKWVHTFGFANVYHPEDPEVSMYASDDIEVENIRLRELADWREAIFIDLESTGQNALTSVILQRPVTNISNWHGNLVFFYDPVRAEIAVDKIRNIGIDEADNNSGSSDGIVYFTNTAVVVDPEYAKRVGFVTRVYRLPDLDNGAIMATRIIQRQARQNLIRYRDMGIRFNPQLEVGDIALVNFSASGTGTPVTGKVIVEAISMSATNGECTMNINGRDANG